MDDHPIIREGLRKLLELEQDIVVMGEAGTGQQALEMSRTLQPDIVLLDINLPNLNGLQVAAQLKTARSRIGVILLTAYDDEEQILHAMRGRSLGLLPERH